MGEDSAMPNLERDQMKFAPGALWVRTGKPEHETALIEKVLNAASWAPTKPPYVVEVFNQRRLDYYISGASCNICVGVFADRAEAEQVAVRCNEIAGAENG